MKNWCLHIILLLTCFEGQGLPPSWNVIIKPFTSSVVFNRNAPKINGQVQPLIQGDAVAVFVRNQADSNYYCAGYRYYLNETDTINIAVNLEDSIKPSFYKLRFFNAAQSCEIELSDSAGSNFRPHDFIQRATGVVLDVHYSRDTLYKSNGYASPINSVPGVIYSQIESGLKIDSLTGIIDLNTSAIGSYTIYLNYKYCLKSVIAQVIISEKRITDTLPDISQKTQDADQRACSH